MTDEKAVDPASIECREPSRRSFLSGAATVGLATALGAAASGQGNLSPGVERSPKSGTAKVRQLKLRRATDRLTFRGPVTVTEAPRGGESRDPETMVPLTTAEPPQPSSRDRLLDAIDRAAGGNDLLREAGVVQREPTGDLRAFGPSSALSSLVGAINLNRPFVLTPLELPEDQKLAVAYASEITLRPDGCEYANDCIPHQPPLAYSTNTALIAPWLLGDLNAQLHLNTPPDKDPHANFIQFYIRTPGTPDQSMLYTFELCISGSGPDLEAHMGRSGLPFGMLSRINWLSVEPPVFIGVVKLLGGSLYNVLCRRKPNPHPEHYGPYYGWGSATFHWLSMAAL